MPRRHRRVIESEPLAVTPEEVTFRRAPREKQMPGDSRKDLHPAHRRRLEMEDAIAGLRECALPMCTQPPIWDTRDGALGVCYMHGGQIAIHFDRLDEERKEVTEARVQREFKLRAQIKKHDEEAAARAIEAGWVYYIRVDERIKIGYSADVRERMRAYPPHSDLLAVHPGTRTLEREMHAMFKGALAAGREWFHPVPDLLAHIEQVVTEFGKPAERHVYRFRDGSPGQTIKVHRRARRAPSGARTR